MKLLYQSLMRRDELRTLKIEDIDFNTSDNFSHKIKRRKGGKPGKFHLDEDLLL